MAAGNKLRLGFCGPFRVEFTDYLILTANFGSTRPQVIAAISSDELQFENPGSANSSAADDLFERFDVELSLDELL